MRPRYIHPYTSFGYWKLFVGLLNFVFDRRDPNPQLLTEVKLRDQHHQVFYDKLTHLYIQMPVFDKKEVELSTHFEKWLYFLKHLEEFQDIPAGLNEPVFRKAFSIAELATYSPAELKAYENSVNIDRDMKGVMDAAYNEGFEKGRKNALTAYQEAQFEKGRQVAMEGALAKLIASGMSETEAKRLLGLE